jgi:hypothetical protein
VTLFRSEGYFNFTKEKIFAEIDTIDQSLMQLNLDPLAQINQVTNAAMMKNENPSWKVSIQLRNTNPSVVKQYHVGKQHFYSDLKLSDNPDSLLITPPPISEYKNGIVHSYKKRNYKSNIFEQQSFIKKGDLYNENLYMKSINNHYKNTKNVISLLIGPSGSGKTTTIIDFIMRCRDNNNYIPFYNIVYFTGSISDESLLNLLKKILPTTIIIDDANKLPKIDDFKNDIDFDKKLKNLIIFDDIGNLNRKQKDIINNWSNSGRKLFSHMFFMCQNIIDVPLTIRRNINYLYLYKSNDLTIIQRILMKYNLYNIKFDDLYNWYLEYTKNKGDFLLLDLINPNYAIRHNFLDILYGYKKNI